MVSLDTPLTVDLLSLIGMDTSLKKVAGTRGGEYAGKCPFCGGHDRFRVQPETGLWTCRHCQDFKWQDAISYVRVRNNCSFGEALNYLGIESSWQGTDLRDAPAERQVAEFDENRPCVDPAYQTAAHAFIDECAHNLYHTDKGVNIYLDYLIAHRGLNNAVLRYAQIGYNLDERHETWGDTDVWLPKGIVIPWLDAAHDFIWKVRFRQHRGADPKYIPAAGGANVLYKMGHIMPGNVVCMVESEFDAALIRTQAWQLGAGFVPVATGGINGARNQRCISELMAAEFVLLSFDLDDAGQQATEFWLEKLGDKAIVHPPLRHDVGDMYSDGFSILDWLLSAVEPTRLLDGEMTAIEREYGQREKAQGGRDGQ